MSNFVEETHAEDAYLMLVRLSSNQSAVLNALYAKYKLNLSTYNILRILRDQKIDGLPITEVAKRMAVRAPDITRCVDKLASQGYVSKKKNGTDKRVTSACISTEGLNLLSILDEPIATATKSFMGMLSNDEITSFIEISKKMTTAFESKNTSKDDDFHSNENQ